MEVQYSRSFLRDLKRLKGRPAYNKIYELVFNQIPEASSLRELANVKAMRGYANRYRIRIGDYRIGLEAQGGNLEILRVLHRREFYRYFP